MSRPVVYIYINPSAESTKILNDFLARHIDQINEHLYVNRVKVTAKNLPLVKQKGIDHTPTLVYNKRKFVSLEKIIKILTPPAEDKDHYGYGNTSSDDLVHQYYTTILDTGDDVDDDNEDINPNARTSMLHQKMANLQKRRTQMDGVDENRKIKGGKKAPTGKPVKTEFNNDDEFRKASRVDNIPETPVRRYTDDDDGAMILEDYYLDEAFKSGKKVGKHVSRKR